MFIQKLDILKEKRDNYFNKMPQSKSIKNLSKTLDAFGKKDKSITEALRVFDLGIKEYSKALRTEDKVEFTIASSTKVTS